MLARWVVAIALLSSCTSSQPAVSIPTPHTPGPLGDTWTRDRGAWHEHTLSGPSPRYLASITYDQARHDYVLFGGLTARGTSGETWTWDGRRWTLRRPAHSPPPRRGAAIAFDPVHRVVVLYGGLVPDQAEGTVAADTWTWNGNDWSEVGGVDPGPGRREDASMVSTPDGVLLFGGREFNTKYYGDVWSFDGAKWTFVIGNTPRGPSGRAAAAVVWNPAQEALLVFGGVARNAAAGPGAQGVPLADTWVLTPPGWVAVRPQGPPSLAFASALWDAAGNRVLVMFGMHCPDPVNDLWGWEGNVAWSKIGSVAAPARWGAAAAADGSGDLVVFGGDDQAGC